MIPSDRLILLVGSYAPDGYHSMRRFAGILQAGLADAGMRVDLVQPAVRLNRWPGLPAELRKWIGYVDKYLIFGFGLRRRVRAITKRTGKKPIVHLCDQANALLLHWLRGIPHLVTCHDLIAVRQSRGIGGPALRWSGRQYQKLILGGLGRAGLVVCSSENTRRDLQALGPRRSGRSLVVHCELNYPFVPMESAMARRLLDPLLGTPTRPIVVHVGGNVWYKNRSGVLRIFRRAAEPGISPPPLLVIAGEPLSAGQLAFVRQSGLEQHVVCLSNPPTEVIQALYSVAAALLFPSLYEGFGWPPVEAQACGCPVVASNAGSLAEVLGGSALTFAAEDEAGMAEALRRCCEDAQVREGLRRSGFANAARFNPPSMVQGYLRAYRQIREES